jgi:hypothetical protein
MTACKVLGLGLERHYVGALLVGAVELHDDVELQDPDMRAVVHASTIAQGWSDQRPAPAEDVAAVLYSLGYPAPAALLIWLMESWDVARERANEGTSAERPPRSVKGSRPGPPRGTAVFPFDQINGSQPCRTSAARTCTP